MFGSLKALADVLSLFSPESSSRAARVQRYVQGLAMEMGLSDVWRLEIAAKLSQIGCINTSRWPHEEKKRPAKPLSSDELEGLFPVSRKSVVTFLPISLECRKSQTLYAINISILMVQGHLMTP